MMIKDVRSVTLPDGNLAWRDTQSVLKTVQTGKFVRNCVLTGKSSPVGDFPIFIRMPGIVSRYGVMEPEAFGYLDASEGTPGNALPTSGALSNSIDYWEATQLGAWIAYHHVTKPTQIRGYRFVTENGYTPRVWRVEGSNDNVTWTTLHSVTVDWTWDAGKNVYEGTVPTENRDYFTHHRLIIDEFDADTVRIYELQFWDSTCPSTADIYIDADANNPLQLAFADGYNQDGTPKDIVKTIISGSAVSLDALYAELGAMTYTTARDAILFAQYDPQTDTVSFMAEDFTDEIRPVVLKDAAPIVSIDKSWDSTELENGYALFDESDATLSRVYSPGVSASARVVYKPLQSFYTHRVKIHYASRSKASQAIYVSEDNGNTYELIFSSGAVSTEQTVIITLDRVYHVTDIKVSYNNYYNRDVGFYTVIFDDASAAHLRKIENGEVYEWKPVTETWEKVYKIPLGYLTIGRNPDNTEWEAFDFIPNHIPSMMAAPIFRKTSMYIDY